MAAENDTDRLNLLSTDDFGVKVVIVGQGTFLGMLIHPFGTAIDVEGSVPRLVCRTSDVTTLTTVAHGTALSIGDDDYTVRGIEPDGEGMTTLVLEES